jgi:hypothetical protein
MNKLYAITCDVCSRIITEHPTEEDRKQTLHTCPPPYPCGYIANTFREDELDRAKEQHLNSDYYWKRKKELEDGEDSKLQQK